MIKTENDLNQRLNQLNQSHIFCDPQTFYKFREIFSQTEQSTLTVLTTSTLPDLPQDAFQISLDHKSYDLILDHCVRLAELDFYDLDLNLQS